jgi:hypothetical protein
MRFGVAPDLWSKEHFAAVPPGVSTEERPQASLGLGTANSNRVVGEPDPAGASAATLQAEKSVASERKAAGLPTLTDGIAPGTFSRWLELLDRLEADLEASRAPFEDVGS